MNQRGVALPMTLIMLVLASTLLVALTVLAKSEPQIATNHMAGSQARAMAEAGVERALWSLTSWTLATNAGTAIPAGSLSDPLPSPVPAPYDGSQYVPINAQGGFVVSIYSAASPPPPPDNVPPLGPNDRMIIAVGYVPNNVNPIAIRKIKTRVTHIKPLSPPCAICAGGETSPGSVTELRIGGSATVNGSPATGAAYCTGVMPTAAAFSQGVVEINGNPALSAPPGGVPYSTNVPQSAFAQTVLSDSDRAILKSLAKANGTYYTGAQSFTTPPKNGIVYVDTPSGNPFTAFSPSSDQFTVDIHGNWSTGWSGWLVVEGSISISGQTMLTGLVYAVNDVNLQGTGGGHITGAVVSANRLDTSSTNIDSDDTGNAPLTYNCPAVRNGGGKIPQGWFVMPGTYREVSGS